MRLPRLLALIRKEFIQIWRDPRSLTITFIMPLVQLFLMGYAATSDALKAASLPGPAWDIVVEPLIPALMALEGAPGVAQVALRAIICTPFLPAPRTQKRRSARSSACSAHPRRSSPPNRCWRTSFSP